MKTSSLLFALIFGLLSIGSQAQIINLGIKAGINIQDLNIKEFDGSQTIQNINSGDQRTGFHGGAFVNINLGILHIRPEFLYTYINHSITTTSFSQEVKNFDFQFNRFDIPILVGKRLGPLRLNAGPVMSYTIGSVDDAFDKGINDATWGYQAGIGLDLGKICIDARYEGSFSKITDNITIDGEDFATDARNNQFLIGIGFKLF